ncbi:M18 family aminopeptidase [Streptomyces sp. SID3343]|uniref:M18 family aminopeptidase n=1 Tax=Streptomyces sp. SID3343 TaxID=2690260 RepID=UPI00136EFA7F|nr:M18 family aminopeptidase [Streptomyces sp. SID3343]MYW06498.1 M18 family aminopeptidase [Streptomyces sp. SID3343]
MTSPRFDRTHTDDLMEFVAVSPSPYHAAANVAARLDAAGFLRLAETAAWDDGVGGRYVLRGGAIVAWFVPEGAEATRGFRILGAHTDSPTLRVKPNPDTGAAGWRQIAVELYGGTLLNSWLDRDLGLSGRIVLRDGSEHLVFVDRPLLRVPQLAIHLDRQVNEAGLQLDKQQHMTPIWGLGKVDEGALIRFVAEEVGVDAAQVAGWDLMVHDVQRPAYLGRDGELLASARLDNLLSVHAGLAALLAAAHDGVPHIPVFGAFDHEETGSESTTGAAGPLLETVLTRIVSSRGGSLDERARAFADSFHLSSDVGHAVHPNYVGRHEPGHHPVPNGGPILKVNTNQRYATDARGRAVWAAACERAGVPWQTFVGINSMGCGTTIGPITAARLGIETVDVGVACLSMHSSRELCGAEDPHLLASAAAAFLES